MNDEDRDFVFGLCGHAGHEAVGERLNMSVPSLMGILSSTEGADLSSEQIGILRDWSKKTFGENHVEHHAAPHEVLAECDDAPPERIGIDVDGDGKDDVYVSVVQGRPGATWTDEQRMLRDGMRRSLAFAQMSRFRVDMSHDEFVAAIGIVTRLELGLISWFGESVPDPKENWDASRRWREIERRIARLRWVAEEDAKEFSGIKGIFNRILGRRRLGGKEMYEKMVAEADWMVTAMRAGRDDADVISEVVSYVGLGSGPPALPGR